MRINEVSMRYTHNQIRMRLELYRPPPRRDRHAAGQRRWRSARRATANSFEAGRPCTAGRRAAGRCTTRRQSSQASRSTQAGQAAAQRAERHARDEPIEPALDNPATRPLDDPFEGDAIPEMLE